jgi:hypothetical protein
MWGSYIKMLPIIANKPRFFINLLSLNATPCTCILTGSIQSDIFFCIYFFEHGFEYYLLYWCLKIQAASVIIKYVLNL